MRLIDADELKELLHEYCTDGDNDILYYYELIGIDEIIDNAPTIDPVKHGRWVDATYNSVNLGIKKCSICGTYGNGHENYCPNCGAKMDGGTEDDG